MKKKHPSSLTVLLTASLFAFTTLGSCASLVSQRPAAGQAVDATAGATSADATASDTQAKAAATTTADTVTAATGE